MGFKRHFKLEKIVNFLNDTFDFIVLLLRILITESYKNYVRSHGPNDICVSKKLIILGNGPSLKNVLLNWKDEIKIENFDILAVNFFCHDDIFNVIMPKYYVLCDNTFFDEDNLLRDKVNKMYDTLNSKVTWKMFLYIQYRPWKMMNWEKIITNKNITVIPFHYSIYKGYPSLRNWFIKKGLAVTSQGTVIQIGEIMGINIGYKEMYLYGVDHNFFDNLCVDENNQLCNVESHFYETNRELQPLYHYYIPGKKTKFTVASYLEEKMLLFYGHEYLRKYADYCSVKIINCTKNSLIDAYERI
jgi:hypothetical protein